MATVIFYEKPGCRNNARQKALLQASGHQVDSRNLLAEAWTAERLRAFFGALPVAAWFNEAAPSVKDGSVVPESFDEAQALAAMIADPLLIRRPLMEALGRKSAGFDEAAVAAWIGLKPAEGTVGEGCIRTDGGSCAVEP